MLFIEFLEFFKSKMCSAYIVPLCFRFVFVQMLQSHCFFYVWACVSIYSVACSFHAILSYKNLRTTVCSPFCYCCRMVNTILSAQPHDTTIPHLINSVHFTAVLHSIHLIHIFLRCPAVMIYRRANENTAQKAYNKAPIIRMMENTQKACIAQRMCRTERSLTC